MLMGQQPSPLFEVELVSLGLETMHFAGGLTIQPQCDIATAGAADVVYVPSIFVAPGAGLPASVAASSEWLRKQHQQGAMLCSACTGSFVLANTGLLNGLPATTHWAFSAQFRAGFPEVALQENAIIIANDDARLVTAGANASWQDLILFIIEKSTAQEVAEETRRMFLIDRHDNTQGAYARCSLQLTADDRAIAQAQQWLQDHLADPLPVENVIEQSNIPSRTFKRRFKKHVGMTVIAYVQVLRIGAAKSLLLSSNDSVENISLAVGYQDAGYFRRIFNRDTGLTPSKYRSMYGV